MRTVVYSTTPAKHTDRLSNRINFYDDQTFSMSFI
jgi:hypothetical protein